MKIISSIYIIIIITNTTITNINIIYIIHDT